MTPAAVAASAASFSPFAEDPVKNARYNAFLNRKKNGDKNPYRGLASPHMTEWEKEREKEGRWESKVGSKISEELGSG